MKTSEVVDQQVAEETRAYSGTGVNNTVRFEQRIKGWSGSGFDSTWRMVEATFFESSQCATVSFECVNVKNRRNLRGGLGSVALDRAAAIKLARAMAPKEVGVAIDAHDQLVAALQSARNAIISTGYSTADKDAVVARVDAALAAAGAA